MKEHTYRVTVHVPETSAEKVRDAIGAAGGGMIGNYSFCSFSVRGIGRFLPLQGAVPAIGVVGKKEQVIEESIEFQCKESQLRTIIRAIKGAHPYEEPGIEIIKLEDLP
jgi:hypothetical protein